MGAARRERGEVTRTGDRWKRGEAEARAGYARACPVSRDALETRRDAMAVGRGDATRTSAASGPPLYTMVSSRRKDETGSGRFSTCGEAGGALGAGAGSSGRASHGAELREHGGSARACVRAARGSGRFDKPEEPSVFSSRARTRRTSIAPASRLKRRPWWRHLWDAFAAKCAAVRGRARRGKRHISPRGVAATPRCPSRWTSSWCRARRS